MEKIKNNKNEGGELLMTIERRGITTREMVEADVAVPADPMRAQMGMHETTMPESLSEIQAEPVRLSNAKPIWAARNPQNPM